MSVQVLGMEKALKALKNVGKQGRFAMSKAINNTAEHLQTQTTPRELRRGFEHLRRGRGKYWFAPGQRYGFNRTFARKDKLESRLYTRADWVQLHEEGGTKRPDGGALAVPQPGLKDASAIVRKAIRPKQIYKKLATKKRIKTKYGMAAPLTTGNPRRPITRLRNGARGLFVREIRTNKIRALYMFSRTAKIKAKMRFRERWGRDVDKVLPREFDKEFERAMRTAR